MLSKLLLGLLLVSNSVPLTIDIDYNQKEYRQYNKANEASSVDTTLNIETTNVDYDLRYIFGGKDYKNFDLNTLLPDEDKDRYSTSKFLCAKPVGNNLYLYFYQRINQGRYELVDSTFTISFSKEKDSETGLYVENYKIYNARFINRYGYHDSFYKVAIDNVVNLKEDFRCNILNYQLTFSLGVNQNSYKTDVYDAEHEAIFSANDNQDYMLDYFRSDYVTITDGDVKLLLTRADIKYIPPVNLGTYGLTNSDWMEDFYYFFSTDRNLVNLEEVQYDYTLTSYTELHDNGRYTSKDYLNCTYTTFVGTMNDISGYNSTSGKPITDKPMWLEEDSLADELRINNRIVKGKHINEVSRPYFFFWNKDNAYHLENIQNCLDTSNLVGDEDKGFLDFIQAVQAERVDNYKDKFQWAFRVGSFIRSVECKFINDDWSWLLGQTARSYTYCHEVKNALIVRLRFKVGMKEYEMNALDVPKDTSSAYIQDVPYTTLGDDVIDFIFDFLESFTNGFDILLQILIIIFLAIVLLILLRLILGIFEFLSEFLSSKKRKKRS